MVTSAEDITVQIDAEITRLAVRWGLEPHDTDLARFDRASDNGGWPYLRLEGGVLHLRAGDRGETNVHRHTRDPDELLYWIFSWVVPRLTRQWRREQPGPRAMWGRSTEEDERWTAQSMAAREHTLSLLVHLQPQWRERYLDDLREKDAAVAAARAAGKRRPPAVGLPRGHEFGARPDLP